MFKLVKPFSSRFVVLSVLTALVLAAYASSALAEVPKLAPGLWELDTVTDGKTLAQRFGGKISAATLKRIQTPSIQITETGLIRFCLSQRSADRGWQPQSIAAGCKYNVKWNGHNGRFVTTCKGKTQSSGDILITDNKAWSSTSRARPEAQGRTVVQSTKAKWAGADCKGLRPK